MGLRANDKGQGTVEAAFVMPLVFLLMLLLLQPGIVLYDYIVMSNAAAEGVRLAATTSSGELSSSCAQFVKNRLSAIPQQDLFHVHDGSCSYEITITGGEAADSSEVRIVNRLKPLPLIDMTLGLLGATNDDGTIQVSVRCSQQNQPDWVARSSSGSPSQWVDAWTR